MYLTLNLSLLIIVQMAIDSVSCAKILFHGMHSSRSHMGSMLPVAVALSENGHDVHFLETSHGNQSSKLPNGIKNHFISISEIPMDLLKSIWIQSVNPHDVCKVFRIGDAALQMLITENAYELHKILNTSWDLVFSDELFSLTSYGIALGNSRKHQKPFVMFSTTTLLSIFGWEQALARAFTLRPSLLFPTTDKRVFHSGHFYDRLIAAVEETITSISVKISTEQYYSKGIQMLGITDFSFGTLWSNSAYNFQEEINSLAYPQPISADTIQVGYHCPSKKHLPANIKNFVDDKNSKGTVYIAFGTSVRWTSASTTHINSFEHIMSQLKNYRVIIVSSGNEFKNISSNVKVIHWAPQFEVLRHPKTKLFISHCGLKSIKEAICAKTPVICIPMFAEQAHNAAIGAKLGFSRTISKYEITPKLLLNMTVDMLENRKYTEAANKTYNFYIDRPIDSLNEAVFWTNRLLRLNARKPTFKRKGMKMHSAEYFYLFEICSLLVVVLFIAQNSD